MKSPHTNSFIIILLFLNIIYSCSSTTTTTTIGENNIYNLYLTKNGNDTTGDGTITKPYFSICKIVECISSYSTVGGNNIKVYIGNGTFEAVSGCQLNLMNKTIVQFESMQTPIPTPTPTPITKSQQSQLSPRIINNIQPSYILNLNINLKNSTLLLNFINLQYFKSNSINKTYNYETFQFQVIDSNLHSINFKSTPSFIAFSQNTTTPPPSPAANLPTILIKNSSLNKLIFQLRYLPLVVQRSNLNEINFYVETNQKLNFTYSDFNNTLIYFEFNQEISVSIDHCKLIYDFSNNIQVFLMGPKNKLLITNTVMESTGEFFSSMVNGIECQVYLINVTFTNWYLLRPFISVSNSTLSLKSTIATQMYIPAFVETSDSTVEMDTLQISGNKLVLINIQGPSTIYISYLVLDYGSQHGSPIMMNSPGGYDLISNITISDSVLSNIDGFTLRYAVVTLFNVSLHSYSENSLFQLSSCDFSAIDSKFTSSLILGSNYLFFLNLSSSVELNQCEITNSSMLFQSTQHSTIKIENSIIKSIFSREVAISLAKQSIFTIVNSIIQDVYSVSNSFIFSAGSSEIAISNCTFIQFSLGLNALGSFSDSTTVEIENLLVDNSFFQNQIFVATNQSELYIDSSKFTNNSVYGSEMILLSGKSSLSMENSVFADNSFSICLQTTYSLVNITNVTFISNTGTFLYSSNSYFTLKELSFSKNPISSLYYLFYFLNSFGTFENLTIDSNFYMGSVIESHRSSITFSSFQFTLNENVDNLLKNRESPSLFFNHSIIEINNSEISSNFQWTLDLIYCIKSNLTFDNTTFYNNSIPYDGYLLRAIDTNLKFHNSLVNSTFSINGTIAAFFSTINITFTHFTGNSILDNGGALFLNNYDNNSILQFGNNTFHGNNASIGGAIFTQGFMFDTGSDWFRTNSFSNNSAVYGDNFGSFPTGINISQPNIDSTTNTVSLFDNYTNLVSDDIYTAIINIYNPLQSIQLPPIVSNIRAGVGTFNYSFNQMANYIFYLNISVENVHGMTISYTPYVEPPICLEFQLNTPQTQGCQYCPITQALSPSTGKCESCDQSIMVCLESQVYTLSNYFMYEDDVKFIYECPVGMCFGNNSCASNMYMIANESSPLCSRCTGDSVIGYPPSLFKNGIHCCTHFQPLLIIPYLVFILFFGLLLSLFKHIIPGTFIGTLIIFIQGNSVLFHSFSGIYIIPLFRISIDYIDDFCLFKISYFEKVSISTLSILIVFLIGISNWSAKLLFVLIRTFPNGVGKRIPKSIEDRLKKYQYYKENRINTVLKYSWNLYLMILQPLVYNLISLIIPKTVGNQTLLSIDPSILFITSPLQILFFSSSILILFFTVFIIPIMVIINCFYPKLFNINDETTIGTGGISIGKSFFSPAIYKVFSNQYHYRELYKWWDLIYVIKSVLFSFLSISLMYDPTLYFSILIVVQLTYAYGQFILHPQKKDFMYRVENICNLFQLSMVIFLNTQLMKSISSYVTGVILSSLILFCCIFIIFYKYFIYKKKSSTSNNNNEDDNDDGYYKQTPSSPPLPSNNNKNNNNLSSSLSVKTPLLLKNKQSIMKNRKQVNYDQSVNQ